MLPTAWRLQFGSAKNCPSGSQVVVHVGRAVASELQTFMPNPTLVKVDLVKLEGAPETYAIQQCETPTCTDVDLCPCGTPLGPVAVPE